MRTGPDELTASERRVCELAANGLSNPDIAQTLFVTRKTVETHLGRAYRKLDVSGRSELAAALRRTASIDLVRQQSNAVRDGPHAEVQQAASDTPPLTPSVRTWVDSGVRR